MSTKINFRPPGYPIKRLENSRLLLEPFDFAKHAAPFVEACKDHPGLFDFVPYGPFPTIADFKDFYPAWVSNPAVAVFAVFAKSSSSAEQGTMAGTIGWLNANPGNATIELGFITIFPPFQRTYVTSNAVGLLLSYTLDLPPHGLGLRRSQWQTHASNEASRRVALRMGYTLEGIQRFQRAFPAHKQGNGFDLSRLPENTGIKLGQARDSAMFAHYCDEWPEKRVKVLKAMEPR